MAPPGGLIANFFILAQPGTLFEKIYKEKMTEADFVNFDESIPRILNEYHFGTFYTKDSMLDSLYK